MTLLEFFRINEPTTSESMLKAEKRLLRAIDATADNASGIVTIEVRLRYASLAEQVAQRIVGLTNDLNVRLQRDQSAAERQFAERQMAVARSQLYAAEDSLRWFMERNRDYETSPRLKFESTRLTRRVSLAQGVYTTMAQTYEQAAISAAQNTPVIRVIDEAHGSATRTPGLRRLVAAAVIFGIIMGIGVALLVEYLSRQLQAQPQAFAELRRHARPRPRVREASEGKS
jgi:uncharacterized protein involved in exopolysaccharide biosynthesis